MTQYTFTRTAAGTTTAFSGAKYWSPTGVPGSADDAILPAVTKANSLHTFYTVVVTKNTTVNSIATGAGAVLQIGRPNTQSVAINFATSNGSGGGVVTGEIAIAGLGASFTFGGTLDHTGLIDGATDDNPSEFDPGNSALIASNGTLSGGGMVEYVKIGGVISSSTLTNLDNTIVNSTIAGVTFINTAHGVLNLDYVSGGASVVNAGTIHGTGFGLATVDGSGGGLLYGCSLGGADVIGGTLEYSNTAGSGNNGPTLFDGTTSTVKNLGALEVNSLNTIDIQGILQNSGQVLVTSTGPTASLVVTALGATLTGAGTVSLGGPLSELTGATPTATLTNVDNTISGVGYVGLKSLTLINESAGVIEAVGKGSLMVNTGAQTLINAGLMEAAAGSTLALASQVIDQTGGGVISALAGGRVDLQGADVIGGAVTSTGNGVVDVNAAGAMLDGRAGAVTVGGTLSVVSGQSLTVEGAIALAGEISVGLGSGKAGLIVGAAGATLTGAGEVALRSFATNTIEGASSAATLTNASHIAGGGALGDGQMTLVNQAMGAITGDVTTPLTIDTGANTIVNAGQIGASAGSSVVVKSAVDETASTSRLAVAGGTLTLDGAVTGTGGTARINGGVIDFASSYNGNVWFTGTAGTVELSRSQGFTGGTITGFSTTGGTALDLQDIAYVRGTTKATYVGTASGGVLTVTSGAEVAKINFAGDYLDSTWTLSAATGGGTQVVDPTRVSAAVPRFAQAMAGAGARAGAAASSPPHVRHDLAVLLASPRCAVA